MPEDIALDIDARCYFDQLHAARRPLQHASFGDVEHGLADFGGVFTGEGYMLDRLDEFTGAAFAHDSQRTVLDRDRKTTGRERTGEDELLGILRDIDEAPGTGELASELADIDVAGAIDLRHPETGEIQAATVV